MPSPIGSTASARPTSTLQGALLEYNLLAGIAGAIGTAVFPVVDVATQAGEYLVVPAEEVTKEANTERAAGGDYNLLNTRYAKGVYATVDHGLRERVDKRQAAIVADHWDAKRFAAQRLQRAVLLEHEKRVAAKLFNASTYTGAALTTAVSVGWYAQASAQIRADIANAMDKVEDVLGLPPNALVVSRKTFRRMRLAEDIVKTVHAQGAGDRVKPEDITADMLARAIGLDRVIVGGNSRNSADEGQAFSAATIWNNDYAMVCRIAETDDPAETCIGRTYHWAGNGSSIEGVVTEEEFELYTDVRVHHDVDEVHLIPEAGHLITNVSATS